MHLFHNLIEIILLYFFQHCINGVCVVENENTIPDYSQHTPRYVRYFGNSTKHRYVRITNVSFRYNWISSSLNKNNVLLMCIVTWWITQAGNAHSKFTLLKWHVEGRPTKKITSHKNYDKKITFIKITFIKITFIKITCHKK